MRVQNWGEEDTQKQCRTWDSSVFGLHTLASYNNVLGSHVALPLQQPQISIFTFTPH